MDRNQVSRVCIAMLALAAASCALAQNEIYSNGSANPLNPGLSTGSMTASGIPAPSSFEWSELQVAGGAANAVAGFSSHETGPTGAFRFADDFIVTGAHGWRIDRVLLYAYQTDHSAQTTPFAEINLRIWDGPPGGVDSAVIFGDTTTNRMLASNATNLYRIFTSTLPPVAGPPDTARVIWESEVNAGPTALGPGTYWLDWQYVSIDGNGEAFCPAVTIVGSRSGGGFSNAQQFKTEGGGAWIPAVDVGKPPSAFDVPQDFPFILTGEIFITPCNGDTNYDRIVDLRDLTNLLSGFGTTTGGTLETGDLDGDGDVDLSDLSQLLGNFGVVCT